MIAKFRCFVSVFSFSWSDYFAYESIRNVFFGCYCVFVLNFSATTCSTLIESHPGLSSVNFSTTPHQCATKDISDIIYNIFQYSTFFNIQTHFQNDFSKAHHKCAIDKGSMPTKKKFVVSCNEESRIISENNTLW